MKEVVFDFSNKELFNYKYIPLLSDTKRYNFLLWSWWSGKSVFVSQKEIIKSFQKSKHTLCVRKVWETLKDSCYAELKSRISEWWLDQYFKIIKNPLSIKNLLTWCEFIFKGMDDPEKIKSIADIDRVWIEEATELKKADFDQLDLRLRWKKNMQITASFNPVDADHWLNNDFWKYGNTENQTCLHSTYKDNRFVWPEYEIVMERLKIQNYNYYKIYALWEWGTLEGLIFENWEIIPKVPEEAKFLWYWLDFWYTNDPTAFIGLYMWNNSIILDEEIYETWLTNTYREESKKEKSIVWKFETIEVKSSTEIYADSSEPKSIEEIHGYWYNIKPTVKWQWSVNTWIDLLLWYKIYITARSWNTQKEFRKYVRKVDKNGKKLNEPIDENNHAIDASRYIWIMKLQKKWKKKIIIIKT